MINTGVSFGLLPGLSWIILLGVLVGLTIYAVKMRELWGRIGIGMIIVGGAGNLTQRLIYGGVVDNLNFFGLFYNNVWDYVIVVGVGICLVQVFRRKL
jgi:lipoprotein signal peptidase